MLSRTKLKQTGAKTILHLKKYDNIVSVSNTNSINHDVFLKYRYSLSDNGFSGVSSGHKTNMTTVEIKAIIKRGNLKSYRFANLIITMQRAIDMLDKISQRVSVFAWYPPAYLRID